MDQTHYEVRPMKDERPVKTFDDKSAAIQWVTRRNQDGSQPTRVRLVEVTTHIDTKELVL